MKNWAFGVLVYLYYSPVQTHASDLGDEQEFDYGSEAKEELKKYTGCELLQNKALIRSIYKLGHKEGHEEGFGKGHTEGVKIARAAGFSSDFDCGVTSSKDLLEQMHQSSKCLCTKKFQQKNKNLVIPLDIQQLFDSNKIWMYKYRNVPKGSDKIPQFYSTTESPPPPPNWLQDVTQKSFIVWYAILTVDFRNQYLHPAAFFLRDTWSEFKKLNKEKYKKENPDVRFAAYLAITYRMLAKLTHATLSSMRNYGKARPQTGFIKIIHDFLPGYNMSVEQIEMLNIARKSMPNGALAPLEYVLARTEESKFITIPYDRSEDCMRLFVSNFPRDEKQTWKTGGLPKSTLLYHFFGHPK